MTISLDHRGFRARTAVIAARTADLAQRRDRISTSVDDLLASWRGPAGSAFSDAWLAWRASADDVIATLAATTDALASTHADLTGTDGSIASDHDRIAARLGT